MILKSIRKQLKVFSILSSLAILTPTRTNLYACGWGSETEELRYMVFNPDLLKDKSWWTFFYNNRYHYLDGTTFSQDDETLLTQEWLREMKIKSDEAAARECLFGGLSDSLLQINSFYQQIQKNDAFLKYFELAKRCETISTVGTAWDSDEEKAARLEAANELMPALDEALAVETNPFLKRKYAYQVLRASYYTGYHKQVNERFKIVYDTYFKKATNRTVLDWWALHYRSMFMEGDSANYLHAIIFNNSSAKRYVSRLHFSTENLGGVLALAQNDEERADIYVLASSINPGRGLEYLQKVYELAPNHRQLPLLVGREINKLEDWLGTNRFGNPQAGSGYIDEASLENLESDRAYLQEVITQMEGMTELQKKFPDFYNLSMANLYLMKGDAGVLARKYLDEVKSDEPEVVFQERVLRIILLTQQGDIRDGNVQNEIGELFQSLIHDREKKFESQKILYSVSSYLRYQFANAGMVHLAGLFDNMASNKFCYSCRFDTFEYSMISYFDRYASVDDIAKVIDLYDRPDKNKLETILLLPYSNKNYLYDLLAVKYLRKGDLKNCLLVLSKIPDSFWFSFMNASENLNGDPFLGNAELFGVQTIASYNRREIVEKMIQLETDAASNRDKRGANYLQLANAWYNFTADFWFMLSYGNGSSTPDENVYRIGQTKALEYYKKALAGDLDKETRAKVLYMITLLSDGKDKVSSAKLYEAYRDTDFYNRKNCLTTQDIASGNF